MGLLLDGSVTAASAGLTADQISEVTTNLVGVGNTILDTFIDLLPIAGAVVGVCFAIRFIRNRFGELKGQH